MVVVWMYEKGRMMPNSKFKTIIPPNGKQFATKKAAKADANTWAQNYDTKLFRLNTNVNPPKRDSYEYFNKKGIIKR